MTQFLPPLRLHNNKYKTYCLAIKGWNGGTLLQLPFDSVGVSGTCAARFWGFLPLIRHLYLGSEATEAPHNPVVDGGVGPKRCQSKSGIGSCLQKHVCKNVPGLIVMH